MERDNGVTYIGVTNFRNKHIKFGIRDVDRLNHIYCIGKSGTGKSTLLKNMAIQDIQRGNGLGVIDPHGDVAEELLKHIPEQRKKDLIYFNPANLEHPIAFNPLHGVHPNYHHLVASGLISTFKKIWIESWGPRLEYILRFSLLTLLWYPEATLLDIQPLLTDKEFRNHILLKYVNDQYIETFWKKEFDAYGPTLRNEAISPILNKTGLFISSLPLRNIVGQKISSFKMQRVMDEGKIFLANLSKGKIGEDISSLLGSMLVTSMQLAAMHRAVMDEHKRNPFYLYIDEVHSFVTQSFADILAEARKYRLSLFLTHQYVEQLDEKLKDAIIGNAGTLICFRVGAKDAESISKEFLPIFSEQDLINLPRHSMYLKLMIDGTISKPFSSQALKIFHARQSPLENTSF